MQEEDYNENAENTDEKLDGWQQTGKYTPNYTETVDPDLIKHQLHLDDNLKEILSQLNMMGASIELKKAIIMELKSVVNRNTFLSNYDEESVMICSQMSHQAIVDALFEYGDNLSISQKSVVWNSVGNFIFSSFRRPMNQGERGFLSRTVETKHIMQTKQAEERKFTLGKLFRR